MEPEAASEALNHEEGAIRRKSANVKLKAERETLRLTPRGITLHSAELGAGVGEGVVEEANCAVVQINDSELLANVDNVSDGNGRGAQLEEALGGGGRRDAGNGGGANDGTHSLGGANSSGLAKELLHLDVIHRNFSACSASASSNDPRDRGARREEARGDDETLVAVVGGGRRRRGSASLLQGLLSARAGSGGGGGASGGGNVEGWHRGGGVGRSGGGASLLLLLLALLGKEDSVLELSGLSDE